MNLNSDIAASELVRVTKALAVANANVDNLENILKKEKDKIRSGQDYSDEISELKEKLVITVSQKEKARLNSYLNRKV